MPRSHEDFEKAYGPMLAKWTAQLGAATVKEIEADWSPAIRSLIEADAAEMHGNGGAHHAKVLHTSLDNYDAWKATKGF